MQRGHDTRLRCGPTTPESQDQSCGCISLVETSLDRRAAHRLRRGVCGRCVVQVAAGVRPRLHGVHGSSVGDESTTILPVMPLFLDRHDAPGATAVEIAAAHALDVRVQDHHGVRYVTYWFDEAAGKVFCLAEGPDRAALEAVHREAHGLVADDIIEVGDGPINAFLGPIPQHPVGEATSTRPSVRSSSPTCAARPGRRRCSATTATWPFFASTMPSCGRLSMATEGGRSSTPETGSWLPTDRW